MQTPHLKAPLKREEQESNTHIWLYGCSIDLSCSCLLPALHWELSNQGHCQSPLCALPLQHSLKRQDVEGVGADGFILPVAHWEAELAAGQATGQIPTLLSVSLQSLDQLCDISGLKLDYRGAELSALLRPTEVWPNELWPHFSFKTNLNLQTCNILQLTSR